MLLLLQRLLIKPPIVDSLRWDPASRSYVATFVPEDEVSREETETVRVARSSLEGRRMGVCIEGLATLLSFRSKIDRICHGGDGRFAIYLKNGRLVEIEDLPTASRKSMEAHAYLNEIAQQAQFAFRVQRLEHPERKKVQLRPQRGVLS
jgi:hypothetical protein